MKIPLSFQLNHSVVSFQKLQLVNEFERGGGAGQVRTTGQSFGKHTSAVTQGVSTAQQTDLNHQQEANPQTTNFYKSSWLFQL